MFQFSIKILPGVDRPGPDAAWANAAANVVGPTGVEKIDLWGDGAMPNVWRSEKSAMLSSPSENRLVSVISYPSWPMFVDDINFGVDADVWEGVVEPVIPEYIESLDGDELWEKTRQVKTSFKDCTM